MSEPEKVISEAKDHILSEVDGGGSCCRFARSLVQQYERANRAEDAASALGLSLQERLHATSTRCYVVSWKGLWPVGAYTLVWADSEEAARKVFALHNREQIFDVTEMATDPTYYEICDGDY